jgi:hypothetical protein
MGFSGASQALGWIIGVVLSIISSLIGAFSKLAIRKSFRLIEGLKPEDDPGNPGIFLQAKRIRVAGIFGMSVLNPLCGVIVSYSKLSLVSRDPSQQLSHL